MVGSTTQSARAVRCAVVLTHGKPETIGPALGRLERIAEASGVELVFPEDERMKHGLTEGGTSVQTAELAVVLGGDGTMLRALQRFLETDIPVVGVNFGRVGFLATMDEADMEAGLPHVFACEYRVAELPALDVDVGGTHASAINDVVATSSTLGRMIEVGWAVGGEDLGSQHCDGVICCTPSGSTAYNLSNGGPVLVRGLEAMAITFVAPHSLHARPLVVPRGSDVTIENRTPDVGVTVLVDGHPLIEVGTGDRVTAGLGQRRSLLATLPEVTFFTRYRQTFGS